MKLSPSLNKQRSILGRMLVRPVCFAVKILQASFSRSRNLKHSPSCFPTKKMVAEALIPKARRPANFRLCNVSSYTTEVLEILTKNPTLHVYMIPGNPGIISFYKDFIEYLHELLGGSVSITAIGHISQTNKDWEHGRLFSLQEQIDHKIDFIMEELHDIKVPLVLVGHSIGSYMSIEVFKRFPDKVTYCIGLYPFLTLNMQSFQQTIIGKLAGSLVLSTALCAIIASLGRLPNWALRLIVRSALGRSWSSTAVDAACSHLTKYHVMRNVLFLAMTEFQKLSEAPEWAFLRERRNQIAFLFGVDDHWGPLHVLEEISKQVPNINVSIERENHTHGFCCTEAGSLWVAKHVESLIKSQISCSSST